MLDVLLSIPLSSTTADDTIKACYLLNESDPENQTSLKDEDIKAFRSEELINWYTRDTFLYRALNKACRTLNSSAIIPFHSVVTDLDGQLRRLHIKENTSATDDCLSWASNMG